jgi:hypothetical protein
MCYLLCVYTDSLEHDKPRFYNQNGHIYMPQLALIEQIELTFSFNLIAVASSMSPLKLVVSAE